MVFFPIKTEGIILSKSMPGRTSRAPVIPFLERSSPVLQAWAQLPPDSLGSQGSAFKKASGAVHAPKAGPAWIQIGSSA